MKNITFFIAAIIISTYSNAQVINDESYLDMEFVKFKAELTNCVIAKDTIHLKRLLADSIQESNDGCGFIGCPKNEFIQYYFDESANESWQNMLSIIRFGFSRINHEYTDRPVPHSGTVFQGPSYLKKIDEEKQLVILGENVNIRKEPGINSPIIRKASFEIFSCDCNIGDLTELTYQTVNGIHWVQIKLGENQVGYVAQEFTSVQIDKEMTIAKVKGQWKIISFYHPPGC
jgi:hypothetical protein